MKSLEAIKHDNKPKRVKGEVAAGRARRKKTVLYYAKAQLEGGVPWGQPFFPGGRTSIYICQKCSAEMHIDHELDPCAFCNSCKDAVLDMLAEAVIAAAKKTTRKRKR